MHDTEHSMKKYMYRRICMYCKILSGDRILQASCEQCYAVSRCRSDDNEVGWPVNIENDFGTVVDYQTKRHY